MTPGVSLATNGTAADQGWWGALEDEVLGCLDARGGASSAEIARCIGLSEDAVCSVLAMLAGEGRVRIRHVELP